MHLQIVVLLSILLGSVKCLDLGEFYGYLRDDSNSSNVECEKQKSAFLQGLKNGDDWSARMLDAYGRRPKGITQGNSMDLGMFDQCLAIAESLNTTNIKGKYCFPGLVVPLIDLNPDTSQLNEAIKMRMSRSAPSTESTPNFFLLAACVPNACSPSDLFGPLGVDSTCQTKNESKKLDTADIACICFFSVIACLVTASTGYDLYLQRTKQEAKHPILIAFSFYTNGNKILKTTQQPDQISCFNGLKVLSMFWVILGHSYSNFDSFAINKEEISEWRKQWYSIYALLAPLSVDTFLFISGALLAYVFLKTMRKPNQKFNIGMYYLHRYLRITPALAVLYFFMVTLVRRIQDGPLHPQVTEYVHGSCINGNWWSFFLYIQNYVTIDRMCMAHTWYLSIDMQLYIISPLLLLPMLYYGKRVTYLVLPILVLAGITSAVVVFYYYDIVLWSDDYHNLFYYVTHMRFPPWLIGIICGAFITDYLENKARYQINNKVVVLAIWVLVACLIGFLFFYQHEVDYNHTRIKSAFFIPLQRPLWALCLCWISFACLSGNGGFLNSFLSASIFQVLSKITYSTYLVHQPIIMLSLGHMRILTYFTDIDGIMVVLPDICLSCLAGFIWTLAFESPILVIEKVVFGGSAGRKAIQQPKDFNNADHRSVAN